MKTFTLAAMLVASGAMLAACSADSQPADGGQTPDSALVYDGGGAMCGGSVCAAGSVCCGPAACGYCVPEDSGAYCPPSCPDAGLPACGQAPAGFCDLATATSCVVGPDVCSCVAVCSGTPPPPGEDYAWSCLPPLDERCPTNVPREGDTCPAADLACSYGLCSGAVATCTDGKWVVEELQPSP